MKLNIRVHPLAVLLTMASVALGIFLISWGNHLASRDWTYSSVPWTIWGVLFIITPVLVLMICFLIAIACLTVARHRTWKASLSPRDRMAADAAEAAVLTAAAAGWAWHQAGQRERVSLSAMGRGPLNPVHQAIMDRTARLNAASMQEPPQ